MSLDTFKNKFSKNIIPIFELIKEYIVKNKAKSSLFGIITFLLARHIGIKCYNRYKRYPPGPVGLPIVGLLFTFILKGQNFSRHLSKKYGDIVYLTITQGHNAVIVNHSSIVDQILLRDKVTDHYLGMSTDFNLFGTTNNILPLSAINGEDWNRRRKLAKQALIGISTSDVKKIMELSILNTLFPFLNDFVVNKKEWKPREIFGYMSFNTIYHMNFGEPSPYNDPVTNKLVDYNMKTNQMGLKAAWLVYFPFLKHVRSYYQPLYEFRKNRTDLYRSLIEKRIKSPSYDKSNPQSYIDYMWSWYEKNEITMDEMIADAFTMFSAGTDTTSTSLEYSILLLCKYPNIQQQVYDELFGIWQQNNNKFLNANDNEYLLYDSDWFNSTLVFRAFIHEMHRISNIVSQGAPHCNTNQELTITIKKEDSFDNQDHEYVIPANTIIIYHTEYIHTVNNKENWIANSEDICLENWYDYVETNNEKKKIFSTKNRPFYTFGVGKRDCVGRPLAEKEVQIILGYLILNFEFSFYNEQDAKNPSNVQINMQRVITSFVHPQIGVLINRRKRN